MEYMNDRTQLFQNNLHCEMYLNLRMQLFPVCNSCWIVKHMHKVHSKTPELSRFIHLYVNCLRVSKRVTTLWVIELSEALHTDNEVGSNTLYNVYIHNIPFNFINNALNIYYIRNHDHLWYIRMMLQKYFLLSCCLFDEHYQYIMWKDKY